MIGRHLLGVLARDEAAEMTSHCTIGRAGAAPVFNAGDGTYAAAAASTLYDGPCQLRALTRLSDRSVEAGGEAVSLRTLEARIPTAVDTVAVGDTLTVTACPDGALVGAALVIVDVAKSQRAVTRRLVVREVSA